MTDDLKPGWVDQLRSVLAALEESGAAVRVLHDGVRHNVGPPNADQLGALHGTLNTARSDAKDLLDRLYADPLGKLVHGSRLTSEDYYFLGAQQLLPFSNKSVGLSNYDDCEICDMFFYEDEDRLCYINPSLKPRPPDRIASFWSVSRGIIDRSTPTRTAGRRLPRGSSAKLSSSRLFLSVQNADAR